jgi:phosphoribosylamine---glycine ligase
MKVLLVGSGGREHALAASIAKSPLLTKLYCAPGNPGIAKIAECVAIGAGDIDALLAFAKEKRIGFAISGPELPLVAGFFDRFEAAGIKAFGPSAAGAQLEGSKGFVRDLCAEFGIPGAAYKRFRQAEPAKSFAASLGLPVVIKADGLAAGKGVIIAETREQADTAIDEMFAGAFGKAGAEIVVEEYLEGEEASFFALTDGEAVLPLAGAQDHKRAYDGDKGPNTGGMGAYSPAPVLSPEVAEKALEKIVKPTVAAMKQRGTPYQGVLYAGLMIKDGEPKLIEYNCRFGDPEAQVLLPRLKTDLLAMLIAAREATLGDLKLEWSGGAALTVVMAAKGYPGDYAKGSEIRRLDTAAALDGVSIFHAGTAQKDGAIVANGGRVLNVTAVGGTIQEAKDRAYAAVDAIDWPEGFCRRDIGWRAIRRKTTDQG